MKQTPPNSTHVFAPAKVNLTLHVTGQRSDGYHLLDSLVVFADICDHLTVSPQDQLSLDVTGPFADGVPGDARNLVWQAAELAGQTPHITLEKNLPHGAGIGGGSSNAAAVLRHFGVSDGAEALGADVPVCLNPAPTRMRGIGDQLSNLPELPNFDLVLVNPGGVVPTAEVFAASKQKENPPMPDEIPLFMTMSEMCEWLSQQRNDLETPARNLFPQIDAALAALEDASLARMSGSGGTCFGIYENGAEAAAHIGQAHPTWWVASGRKIQVS